MPRDALSRVRPHFIHTLLSDVWDSRSVEGHTARRFLLKLGSHLAHPYMQPN